jgi:hypothetical protein
MSDVVQGAAGTVERAAVDFIGGFAPAVIEVSPEVPAQGQEPPAEPPVEQSQESEPQEKTPPLAEVIRKAREERKLREQHETRTKDLESQLAQARAEAEKLRNAADFERDPLGYAKVRGWSKEQQALIGQILLYDLVPEKATPEIRQRLFEAKQAQREREREERERAEAEIRAQEAQRAQFEAFVGAVGQAARQFQPGSYPESEAFFIHPDTGEMDHDTYTKSLVATANNLATVAQQRGEVADLRPENLARVLEAEVARRMKARDERRSKRSPEKGQQVVGTPAGGMQPADSTKGMTGAGSPRQPARTDAERIQRAIEAGWKSPGAR